MARLAQHAPSTIHPQENRAGPLDGFRGVAVAAVVLYHLQVPGVGGGLLGVDIFFVLSGFLITGLLLEEWRRSSAISLGHFWARRARRLLPALVVVLVVVGVLWRVLAQPAEVAGVRDDTLATLFYVVNWHSIAVGHSYFTAFSAPSPLLHTWSLAVEEQFYLVWPLVAVAALVWRRSARLLLGIAIVGALVSAAWMAVLSLQGADPSRLYFGTDTRAQTVMIGATLAIALHLRGHDMTGIRFAPPRQARHARARHARARHARLRPMGELSPSARWLLATTGALGAAFIAWALLRAHGSATWLYRGGLFTLGLAVDAVLAAIVLVPRGWLARGLSLRPLRVLGLISYGVYLIHWPVIVAMSPARTGLSGWVLRLVQVAVTLALAVTSFALVELPIRERRLRIPRPLVTVPVAVAAMAGALVLVPVPSGAGSTLAALANAKTPAPPPAAPAALLTPATTAPPQVLAAAVTHPGPVRAMIEGDSVAWSLGNGISGVASSAGFTFANEGYVGCGIAVGGATSFAAYTQPPACLSWPQRWQSQTDTFRPDVTLVLLGRWELVDRVHDGVWMHIGEPAFDAYLTAQLESVVHLLTSDGGRVGFLTSPCNNQAMANAASPGRLTSDDANRVLLFNDLLAKVAAAHPGTTEMVPFRDLVCPDGQYQQTLGGSTLRTSDGVHMEPLAGHLFVQRLWPQIAAWLAAPVLAASPTAPVPAPAARAR
jgi:peptidoglycan/LPS O-acetylase OafA/YrhL